MRINATRVGDAERLEFLPRHFGRYALVFESALFARLGQLSQDYCGGYWDLYDLNNGGCYLAPTAPKGYRVIVAGNGFDDRLDADAVGIVATLFTSSYLSFRYLTVNDFADRFHQLREFALEHRAQRLIFAAID